MARPRIDRPIIGKPRCAWAEARRKNGKIVCFYLRFRDQTGQAHTVETIKTTSRNKAEKRRLEWLAGWQLGSRIIVKNTRDAFEQFLASKLHRSTATQDTYRERVGDFCSFMNWTDCREWTHQEFKGYIAVRIKGTGYKTTKKGTRVKRRPWKGGTPRSHATTIQTFFNWLYVEDITTHDVGKDHKGRRCDLPTVAADTHVKWVELTLYRLLMEALADPDSYFPIGKFGRKASTRARLHELEPAVVLASMGFRLHDLQTVQVGRLHRRKRGQKHGTIDVSNMKGYSTRVIPLPKDAEAVLERQGVFRRARNEFVMEDPRFRDRTKKKSGYCLRILQDAAAALGVYDNFGNKLTWHTLRRSCGVWLAHQGRNEADVGKALGHKPGSTVTKRYLAAVLDPVLAKSWLASRA